MRTIHRDIVGGFIFSKDGKLLLGKNRSGGVYEGSFVVPGGGVDEGETKLEALKREMLEETGINIDDARVSKLNEASGQHEKTLRETNERVLVNMDFFNYKIVLSQNAEDVIVVAEDDWSEPAWFAPSKLIDLPMSPPTRQTLVETSLLV